MKLIYKMIIAGCLASIAYHTWLVAYWVQRYHVQIDNNLDLKMAVDEDMSIFDPGSTRSIRVKNKSTGARLRVVFWSDLDTMRFYVQNITISGKNIKALAIYDDWKESANFYDYKTLELLPGTENFLTPSGHIIDSSYIRLLDQLKNPVLVYDYYKEFLPHK